MDKCHVVSFALLTLQPIAKCMESNNFIEAHENGS